MEVPSNMAILWFLVGLVIVALVATLAVWGIMVLARRSSGSPVVPLNSLRESNRIKGRKGAVAVERRLLSELPSDDYRVFSNVRVPRASGSGRIKVDHVVVSRFGLFAIETKTWSGLITPSKDPTKWRQQVGRSINPHDNPLMQNERQVRALARHLDLRATAVHGIVCFSGPNPQFGAAMPVNVVTESRLSAGILGRRAAVLNRSGVDRATAAVARLL